MTRYFYDCPLKAAFMAKYHGMRFDYYDKYQNVILSCIEVETYDCECCGGYGKEFNPDIRFYIHPDSLHLLEPIEGDYLECINQTNAPYILAKANDNNGSLSAFSTNPKITLGQSMFDSWKIIQRNSLPFMRPEIE